MSAPLSPEDLADIKLARAFESMVATEGWPLYLELLSKRSGQLIADLLTPNSSRDDDMRAKGSINALDFAMGLPGRTIAAARDLTQGREPSEEQDI